MTNRQPSRPISGTAAKEAASGLIDKLSQSQGIAYLAELTGFRPQQILLAICGSCVLIFFGFGANILTNVIGFIYPMYKSFQTIEATGYGVTQKDHTEVTVEQLEACVQILMYWVVYTFFTVGRNFHAENVSTHVNQPKAEWLYACAVGEYFSDYLLFWIPFYYFLKLGALLWFIKGEGAKKVYLLFCGLILKKYEPHIDKAVEEMGSHATQFRKDVQTGVGGLIANHSQRFSGAVLDGLSSLSKAADSADTDCDGKDKPKDDTKSMPPSAASLGAAPKKSD